MLLTRSPLSPDPKVRFSLDLHVLSAPPAFVLSQDQTLREEVVVSPRTQVLPASEVRQLVHLELELKGPSPRGQTGSVSLPAHEEPRGLDVNHAVEFSKTAPLASAA